MLLPACSSHSARTLTGLFRLISHGHRSRAELQPAHELQVDILAEPCEQRRSMARQPGMHDELVLVDQSQLRQRKRQLHTSREQSLTPCLLEPSDRLSEIAAHELRVPIDPVQRARYD